MKANGIKALMFRSLREMARKPLYWFAIFGMPLFCFFFLTDLMKDGLPTRVPAGIVDKDHSAISRQVTQNLESMQMVNLVQEANSFTEARHAMQEGRTFGFFLIPENFERDLMAGKSPVITFYTNMTYYVPASLLFKNFKTAAVYTKAGVMTRVLQSSTGATDNAILPMLSPITFDTHPIGNPELNYAIYLCNSFIPGVLQLMIFLVTAYSVCSELKRGTSRRWIQMGGGSIIKALFGKLLPQTLIWWVIALFMETLLFKYNAYPMHGSWLWITVSELMFVLACQGFALFICCVLPNLRFALSICALIGILNFSLAAYSFPYESMYGGIAVFSWILPARYNLLIYVDQALNGIPLYYSRIWFACYIIFIIAPFTLLWRLKREMLRPVYVP